MTTDDSAAAGNGRSAQYRYGAVFALTLALVVFVIAAPSANWSRAVALTIEGLALTVAIATARERADVRHRRAAAVALAMAITVIGVATGLFPRPVTSAVSALATAAIPVVTVGGILRLLRDRGVTVQAVLGALTIYLSLGLLFAWIIGFVSQATSTPYFAQHTSGSEGIRVYFSFTVLTTTGFGDYTAATQVGHALAVIEMLTGQLYLVTVIGVLVGAFVSGRTT